MSARTGIEWTDATWNPVVGCTKVSQGCKHCYAKTLHDRRHKAYNAGKALPIQYAQPFERVQFIGQRLYQPLRWRTPRRVFVNALSDLFHVQLSTEQIAQIFAVMALARRHTFQVLTKRPANMQQMVSAVWFREMVASWAGAFAMEVTDPHDRRRDDLRASVPDIEGDDWPLPNVWLGVSVENQVAADERIPHLLDTPAAVRFLSCEPLLGPVEFSDVSRRADAVRVLGRSALAGIHWVIAGGESGPGARPMHPAWARSLRDQCASAGVPFFFKQWGEWAPDRNQSDPDGEYVCVRPGEHPKSCGDVVFMAPLGKRRAGRVLDGRTWDEMPTEVAHA